MKIAIIEAYSIESPLFEIHLEDSIGSTFNLQIVAKAKDGTEFTHQKTFERFETLEAQSLANRVAALGYIDKRYWSEGTSWDHYKIPQTWAEEKAEAIFNGNY